MPVLTCPLWPPMTVEGQADGAEADSAALVKSAASCVSRPLVRVDTPQGIADFSIINPNCTGMPGEAASAIALLGREGVLHLILVT